MEQNTIQKIEEHQRMREAEENLTDGIARQRSKDIQKQMSKFLEGLK